MSAKLTGQVWDLQIPRMEAWILFAMADHAHHDGTHVFPSQALIAWKTGYSKRQVQRVQESLKQRKILIPEGTGYRGVQHYRLDFSQVPLKAPFSTNDKMTIDKMSPVRISHINKSLHTTSDKMSIVKMSTDDIYDTTSDIFDRSHYKDARAEPSVEPKTKDTTTPSSDSVPKKKGRQKIPEHPLPDDWQPSEKNRLSIIAKYPGANVDRLVDAMESWAHSKGILQCDWEAELRTFARRDWKERGCPEVQTSHGRPPISHDEVQL